MAANDDAPLDYEVLHARLEAQVEMVLSVRRSVDEPARYLSGCERVQQERFLDAVAYISQETVELAYNFCVFGLRSLAVLQAGEWQGWLQHLLATYDQGGTLAAIVAMQQVDDYATTLRARRSDVTLGTIATQLELFIHGLNGRALALAPAEEVYTDTETIYLPPYIARFDSVADNYRLYKAMAVHQWAQVWFGTWRPVSADDAAATPAVTPARLSSLLAAYPRAQRALRIFHRLETYRLDACIARTLPGIYRELLALRALQGLPEPGVAWAAARDRLSAAGTGVADTLALLAPLYAADDVPEAACYEGTLKPALAESASARRVAEQGVALREALAAQLVQAPHREEDAAVTRGSESAAPFTLRRIAAPDMPEGFRFQLVHQGEAVAPVAEVRARLDALTVDLGRIPDACLVPAGHGAWRAAVAAVRSDQPADDAAARDADTWVYDEWDYVRQQHRRDWCQLREREGHTVHDDFVAGTRYKYRGLLKHLYRTFEALRGEDKRLRQQPDGDAIDLDAVVAAYADARAGMEWPGQLFTRRRRIDRDVAVQFLVDMSGSTKGWINDVERESLILLCESLEVLGDRYAIYGFSGFTHKRCELFRIKGLDEAYDDTVRARISGIRPQDYTRMGVFIRHLTQLFRDIEARTKLLITISDGRPDDQDGYRGAYGIEDTRQALFEARQQGIHPYCITIDEQGGEYLPHMFGAASFSVIDDVRRLPYRVSDIYRRLTL